MLIFLDIFTDARNLEKEWVTLVFSLYATLERTHLGGVYVICIFSPRYQTVCIIRGKLSVPPQHARAACLYLQVVRRLATISFVSVGVDMNMNNIWKILDSESYVRSFYKGFIREIRVGFMPSLLLWSTYWHPVTISTFNLSRRVLNS